MFFRIGNMYLLARGMYYMLKHMQTLCNGRIGYSPSQRDLQHLGELFVFLEVLLPTADDATIDLLWAIPGMATFMFNIELISEAMRAKKLQAVPPSKEEMAFKNFDPTFQNHMYFAAAIGHIMTASIFQKNFDIFQKNVKTEGPVNRVRNTGLARAAAKKMFQWYKDPHTLISTPFNPIGRELLGRDLPDRKLLEGSINSPRSFHFPKLIGFLMQCAPLPNLAETNEVLPGLNVADVYNLITHESTNWLDDSSIGPLAGFLRPFLETAKTVPSAWQAFLVKDRVIAIDKVLTAFHFRDSSPDEDMILTGGLLVGAAMGMETTLTVRDDSMFLKVAKLGSREKIDDGNPDSPLTPWAANSDYFKCYYDKSNNPCGVVFGTLIEELLRNGKGFTQATLPDDAVCQHIIEFAMENMSAYAGQHPQHQRQIPKEKKQGKKNNSKKGKK